MYRPVVRGVCVKHLMDAVRVFDYCSRRLMIDHLFLFRS